MPDTIFVVTYFDGEFDGEFCAAARSLEGAKQAAQEWADSEQKTSIQPLQWNDGHGNWAGADDPAICHADRRYNGFSICQETLRE
jgi:hypothetical protein